MRNQTFQAQKNNFPDVDGLWNFKDLALTEAALLSQLPPGESPRASWPERSLELATQLARVKGLQGKIPEAQEILLAVKALLTLPNVPRRPRLEVRYLLEQGRIYCLMNTPVHAQACFLQAWGIAGEIGEDYFSIDTAMMLAITQPPKVQSEWLARALAMAEKSTTAQARQWLSRIYVRRGWDLFENHKFDEALNSFEKALANLKEFGAANSGSVDFAFDIRWDIARTLRALKKIEPALAIQKELLTDLDALGKTNGYVFLEMAECLQILKSPEEAKKFFGLAHQELSHDDWFVNVMPHELSRIQHLGKAK